MVIFLGVVHDSQEICIYSHESLRRLQNIWICDDGGHIMARYMSRQVNPYQWLLALQAMHF